MYLCIRFASLWQCAQSCGIAVRAIFPLKPLALLMAASGSSASRSPPWQSAQLKPRRWWTSLGNLQRRGALHGRVALDAGVLGQGGNRQEKQEEKSGPADHLKYPSEENVAR